MPRAFHQIALSLILSSAAPMLPLIATNPAAAKITSYPASFRAQQMPVTGGTQYVRMGGRGPAVLLLHGFGDTGDMWEPLAAELVKDHTVIVPDLRGMGLSSHPEAGYEKTGQRWSRSALTQQAGQ
jgi:pimeloyl-ACP methyl ester carboxylesterase